MNVKNISELYKHISLEKRASLACTALMKGDSETYHQIACTVPRELYKQRDKRFVDKINNLCELMLTWSNEHWRTFALYLMNERVASKALESGNLEEHREFQSLADDARSRLIALEALIKTLDDETNMELTKILNSELLVEFGDRATQVSLDDQERAHYNELYAALSNPHNDMSN